MHLQTSFLSILAVMASSLSIFARAQNATQPSEPVLLLSEDLTFHFEFLNALGIAIYSGADAGPVLRAAKEIEPGNFTSFSDAFYQLANDTKAQAEDPENAYDAVNVRDTWFAAATYFRRADFYLHGDWENPLINVLWDEQIAAFDKAIAALPVPGVRLQIPADNFTVDAIWYAVANDGKQRPTLILGNGYDGAQEDLYHTLVVPALARGWNCLTYEGPGHPLVRRRQNLGFIPDWERVVTPLVDYLLGEQADTVDASRLALFGYSFGGYLAARAAAFEPRLSAVLLDGGVYDVYDAFAAQLTPELIALLQSGAQEQFDQQVLGLLSLDDTPTNIRWGLEQGLWSFHTHSPYEFLEQARSYNLRNVTEKIGMPVWIADAELEGFFPGQSKRVKDDLGEKATYHLFKGAAGYHCQVGALQELTRVMFAWLHGTLGGDW